MMIQAARILLVAALMTSIGLHWAIMQSAAWIGMAVTYSVTTGSVAQGLSETFDGEHPCPLCQAVKKGKESEQQNDTAPTKTVKSLKLDLAFASIPLFIFPSPPAAEWITTSQNGSVRSLSPESPPPRRGRFA